MAELKAAGTAADRERLEIEATKIVAVEANLAMLSAPLFKSFNTAPCTWLMGSYIINVDE